MSTVRTQNAKDGTWCVNDIEAWNVECLKRGMDMFDMIWRSLDRIQKPLLVATRLQLTPKEVVSLMWATFCN